MTTSLYVGDLHAKPDLLPLISAAADRHHADRIILLGDICDDWNLSNNMQTAWVEWFTDWYRHETLEREIIPLLGNHDIPYWLGVGSTFDMLNSSVGFPGYKPGAKRRVHELIHMLPFRLVWSDGYSIATHAGLTWDWLIANIPNAGKLTPVQIAEQLNGHMNAHRLASLYYDIGPARGGDSRTPSLLWADRSELVADNDYCLTQIVGHTPVPSVTRELGNLWFCDTFSTDSNGKPIGDQTMLLVTDAKPTPSFDIIPLYQNDDKE
ncbi:metallophosphoesterase [Bifidobacterium sp. SO1]|uniref:metallophosphoesterase family protein n=1 Tax=Bifidobacterium sp. SO1 TaxID=2809029 RepID=UPI001BDBCCD3|nr:metallophosphoesterase [Bifidobacterium sp. SO1]MBT1162163.1 metallophosphoesterase [Bifidobacterium sp. SO1]